MALVVPCVEGRIDLSAEINREFNASISIYWSDVTAVSKISPSIPLLTIL